MGKGLGGSVRWRVYLYGLPAMGWGVFLMVTALSRDMSMFDIMANMAGAIIGAYVAQAVLEPVALRKD